MPDIQLPKTKMTIAEFAAAVKSAHPVYKDIPDNTLYQKMITAYPQYKDKVSNPLSGDAEAKTAQDKAQAKSEYGSRFVNGMKSIIPSISDIPSNINRSIDPLNPKYADDRSISQKVSDLGEPESLGAMTSGIALGAIGDSAEPIGKAAEWAGKGIERAGDSPYMRHLGGYSAMGELMHGSPVKAAGLAATPPALTYGGKAMQYLGKRLQTPPTPEPAPTFDYPSRAIKNPPSIPSAPVDVAPVGNISPIDARISNVEPPKFEPLPTRDGESIIDYLKRNGVDGIDTTPEQAMANRAKLATNPLNTAFDPSKLIPNPNVPSAPVTSDLRHSELLNKLGGKQGEATPSKTINIAGKDYQLDSNGNPIGFPNPPMTSIPARQPGADFRIYPNFFNPKYPD